MRRLLPQRDVQEPLSRASFVDEERRLPVAEDVELFARRARLGWDYWGDESLGTASFPVGTMQP